MAVEEGDIREVIRPPLDLGQAEGLTEKRGRNRPFPRRSEWQIAKPRAGMPCEARGNREIAPEMRRTTEQWPHDVPVARFIREDHHHAVLAEQADSLACAGCIWREELHAETRAGALGNLPLERICRRIIEWMREGLVHGQTRARTSPSCPYAGPAR